MAPGTPVFSPVLGLPSRGPSGDRRSALVSSVAAYADTQLAWLRPPVGGTGELAVALADPQAGGFAVDTLSNGTEAEVRLSIARFLSGRAADETVLLYLSCHAVRDHARLYFAATDTWLHYPQRSAVPAEAVLDELERCGAGNRVLILDCCFIGGFAEERGGLDLTAELGLAGRGIAVLSGSRVREYSYEGRPIRPELPRSLFTEGLAAGLVSGAADTGGDGYVSVAAAYEYASRYVAQQTDLQVPQYHLESGQGEIVLGRAPGLASPRPVPRPVPDGGGRRPGGAHESGTVRLAEAPAAPPVRAVATGPAGAREGAPGGVTVEQDKDNAYCVAFSPDGLLLASGGWNRPVRLRDPAAGSLVRELKSAASAYDVAFSPDGLLIATGGRDGTVGLHDLSGKRARARRQTGSPVRALAFSPDGLLLVSGHEDGTVRLWEVPSLARRTELAAGGETVYGTAVSPDGRLIAAACADGAVRLWRTAGADESPVVLPGHTGWATGAAFSLDGRQLVSSGADGMVMLYDPLTLGRTAALRAGDGIVNAIALSPDGSFLAAARETGAVTVWELASGGSETLLGHAGHANDVAFSPDSRLLASAGKDGSVRLWR
jgi:WD40 repeat protein